MMSSDSNDRWEEIRRTFSASTPGTKSGVFLEVMFGAGQADGLFYDAEGNDRTDIFRAMVERLDKTTRLAEGLADRVAVLERLVVQDEARIALEIEKLRSGGS